MAYLAHRFRFRSWRQRLEVLEHESAAQASALRDAREALAKAAAARDQAVTDLSFQKALLQCQAEASPDGLLLAGPDGKWLSFNPVFVEMWDFPPEILEKKCVEQTLSWICSQVAEPQPFHAALVALADGLAERFNGSLLLQDGRVIDYECVPVRCSRNSDLGWIWHYRDVSKLHQEIQERIEIENDLKNSRERLRRLSIHLEAVRERERTRIARNIHDDLGQILSGMKMEVNWLKAQNRLPEPAAAKIESISTLLKEAIRHMRRISQDLRPSVLDNLGLCAAISWQAAEFQQRSGIECRVSFVPDYIAVAEEYKVALFRIFQQTLTNIYQHARATRVDIDLMQHLDSLCLNIKDNGVGIREEDLSSPSSFGLTSIRERVYSLNGQVDITGGREKAPGL